MQQILSFFLIISIIIFFLTGGQTAPPKSSLNQPCSRESGGLWGARGECDQTTNTCSPGKCVQGDCTSGFGKLIFPSGGKYSGTFKDRMFSGTGKLIFCKGSRYEGGFLQDMNHGQETIYFPNEKVQYKGGWLRDKKHGSGTIYYNNGRVQYKEEFAQGKINGHGSYYTPDGILYYRGKWQQNQRHGMGKVFYDNRALRMDGEFFHDTLVRGSRYTRSGKKFFIREPDANFFNECLKEKKKGNPGEAANQDLIETAAGLYSQNISLVENDQIEAADFKRLSEPTIKTLRDICPAAFHKLSGF